MLVTLVTVALGAMGGVKDSVAPTPALEVQGVTLVVLLAVLE